MSEVINEPYCHTTHQRQQQPASEEELQPVVTKPVHNVTCSYSDESCAQVLQSLQQY